MSSALPTLTFLQHPAFDPAATELEIEVVRGCAAPGEMLSLAFALRAQAGAALVELQASDLSGGGNSIAAANSSLYVVKVWPQAGVGIYQTAAKQVPELLLKDDRQSLRDGYRRGFAHWRDLLRPRYYYRPPDLRLHGPLYTTLAPGQAKQIWIALKIPPGTAAGRYSGWIKAHSPDGEFAAQAIALELEVLPITLLEPEQDLSIWFKATLDPRVATHYVAPATFRAQLQDIYDHGFRSIDLNETRREHLQQALDMAAAVGFRHSFRISPRAMHLLDQVDLHGMRPVFYISDEIDARGAAAMATHSANWRKVKAVAGTTMISLVRSKYLGRLLDPADIGCPPDIVSLYLPNNLDYFRAYAAFQQLRTRPTYYYWMSFMEKPNLQRVLAGFYLWKSKANGIVPYCYQHLPRYPFSPFDDFDEWDQREQIGDQEQLLRDHMTTYPAREGTVPTLQWKGLSAGLYDLRYLTTLAHAIGRVAAQGTTTAIRQAGEVQARLQSILARIRLGAIDIDSTTNLEPYPDLAAADYDGFRRQIAQDIVLLQGIG